MATTAVHITPLQPVRRAIFDRLQAAATAGSLGAGVTVASESMGARMPFVAVGPAYKAAGATDPLVGVVKVVVQVDAYASTAAGGAQAAEALLLAAANALQATPLTVELAPGVQSQPVNPVNEDEGLNVLADEAGSGPPYVQRYVRWRFLLTT